MPRLRYCLIHAMILKAPTASLIPLLGLLQGVHSEHIIKRGKSGDAACHAELPSSTPGVNDEHVAGSLLQRLRAVPVEVADPDEEAIGESVDASLSRGLLQNRIGLDNDTKLSDNSTGRTIWSSWTRSWLATFERLPSLILGQRFGWHSFGNASVVKLNVTGVSDVNVSATHAGSLLSRVGKHQLWFPSLAQTSRTALADRGKDALMASYARGELSYIMIALTVSVFATLICFLASQPTVRHHATAPLHQTDAIPRSHCQMPSATLLRPGPGRGSTTAPIAIHGPVMHPGAPASAVSLPSVQASTTAPASCAGLPPRHSFEQALNQATRMSLPSLKEMRPQLCVELVVPPGKECCLQLPSHPFGSLGDGGHIAVNDVQGRPVFDVGFVPLFGAARARWGCFAREDQKDLDKRLVLRSAVDSYVFGSCKTNARVDPMGGRIGLTLCNSMDNAFGVLQQDSSGDFMMKAFDSWFVKVKDCGQAHQRFEDSEGWLLASIEGSDNRIARIAPQVDAGLIVLVVLGIDLISQGLVGE